MHWLIWKHQHTSWIHLLKQGSGRHQSPNKAVMFAKNANVSQQVIKSVISTSIYDPVSLLVLHNPPSYQLLISQEEVKWLYAYRTWNPEHSSSALELPTLAFRWYLRKMAPHAYGLKRWHIQFVVNSKTLAHCSHSKVNNSRIYISSLLRWILFFS